MIFYKIGTVKFQAKLFEKEKKLLVKKLGSDIVTIEHVGSTAIPDISAKPEENRTHHLSIVKADSEVGWKDAIAFRDYLLGNENAEKNFLS